METGGGERPLSGLSKVLDGPEVQSIGGVDVRVEGTLKTLQTRQSVLRNVGKTLFKRRKPASSRINITLTCAGPHDTIGAPT